MSKVTGTMYLCDNCNTEQLCEDSDPHQPGVLMLCVDTEACHERWYEMEIKEQEEYDAWLAEEVWAAKYGNADIP